MIMFNYTVDNLSKGSVNNSDNANNNNIYILFYNINLEI